MGRGHLEDDLLESIKETEIMKEPKMTMSMLPLAAELDSLVASHRPMTAVPFICLFPNLKAESGN